MTLYRSGYSFDLGPKDVGDLNFRDGSDDLLQAPLEAVLGQRPLHSLKGKSLLWQFSVNRAGRGASLRLCCHLKSQKAAAVWTEVSSLHGNLSQDNKLGLFGTQ
jgi:hypothetical protein